MAKNDNTHKKWKEIRKLILGIIRIFFENWF
jgi:hypothetical protein